MGINMGTYRDFIPIGESGMGTAIQFERIKLGEESSDRERGTYSKGSCDGERGSKKIGTERRHQ
jgi:hypothetical protein